MTRPKEATIDTRHLVDPELLPALDNFPGIVLTPQLLPQVRIASADRRAGLPQPVVPGVTTTRTTVPAAAGAPEVGVEVSRPTATGSTAPLPAVLWIHGGGYVLGNAAQDRGKLEQLAAGTGRVFVSVDYRLAPETPYPGPVEDCYAALVWLHEHAAELGVDPGRLGIAGESAGGGLAAAVTLLARDRGGPPLRHQTLVYPMLDDRTAAAPDHNPFTGEFVWTPESNRFGWTALLGSDPGGPDVPGYAAPARAADLAGLPPACICVGALDLFVEEDIEYARRLLRAGVPTELHVYPGAFHGFWMAVGTRPVERMVRDLDAALGNW